MLEKAGITMPGLNGFANDGEGSSGVNVTI